MSCDRIASLPDLLHASLRMVMGFRSKEAENTESHHLKTVGYPGIMHALSNVRVPLQAVDVNPLVIHRLWR